MGVINPFLDNVPVLQKQPPEVLTVSKILQENTCVGVSHLIKTLSLVFSCEFFEIFKNTFFIEYLLRLLLYHVTEAPMKGFFFSYQDVIVPEQPPSPESNEDSISKLAPEKQTLSILNRTNDSGCVIQDSTSFDGSFYDAADCIFFSKNEKVTRPPGTFIYFHLFVHFFYLFV